MNLSNPFTEEYFELKQMVLSSDMPWFFHDTTVQHDKYNFPFYSKKELKKKLKLSKEIYIGDIIINLSKIKIKNKSKKFKSEFDLLWVHGLVHLFGYDHRRNIDFIKMNKIEKKYLNFINA